MTSFRALVQLCCVCLLLAAQQTALTHWAWHAAPGHAADGAHGHAQHSPAHDPHGRGDGRPGESDGHAGSDHDLCLYHAALHDVTGGNCAGGVPGAVAAQPAGAASSPALERASVEAVPAVSRGPPSLS